MQLCSITGGAGFIGSNLVQYALDHTSDRLVIVDKLTYAGSLLSLECPLRTTGSRSSVPISATQPPWRRIFAEVPTGGGW